MRQDQRLTTTILPKNALLWIHVYSPETFKMNVTFPKTVVFVLDRMLRQKSLFQP